MKFIFRFVRETHEAYQPPFTHPLGHIFPYICRYMCLFVIMSVYPSLCVSMCGPQGTPALGLCVRRASGVMVGLHEGPLSHM